MATLNDVELTAIREQADRLCEAGCDTARVRGERLRILLDEHARMKEIIASLPKDCKNRPIYPGVMLKRPHIEGEPPQRVLAVAARESDERFMAVSFYGGGFYSCERSEIEVVEEDGAQAAAGDQAIVCHCCGVDYVRNGKFTVMCHGCWRALAEESRKAGTDDETEKGQN